MEIDNKTLVAAILIILVALVVFNFSNITGQATKGALSSVSVSPTTINAGQILLVSVVPGSNGVYQELEVYERKTVNDIRHSEISAEICNAYKCYDAVDLKVRIPDNLDEGSYYIRIKDGSSDKFSQKYATAEFGVEAVLPITTRSSEKN